MLNNTTVREYNPVQEGLAYDPYTHLTRVFVYFLQNLYRTAPRGTGFHWSQSPEDTEIVITGEKPVCEAMEKIPHIVCILGSSQWGGLGLDQMQKTKISNGERQHSDLISCTMSYHCQAKEGLVARRLAFNSSLYTNVFVRMLQQQGGLHHVVRNHSISGETPPTAYSGQVASSELVSVVATIPFHWQVQWRIRSPAELWRGMKMSLGVTGAQAMYSAGKNVPIRPPMIKGHVVSTVPFVTPEEPAPVALTQEVKEDSYPK
jgi:hypothetical protein